MWPYLQPFAAPFVTALIVAVVLTPFVRRMAARLGMVSRPRADRWHRRPVALLGGVGVWIAAVGATFVHSGFDLSTLLLLVPGTLLFLFGLVDDAKNLKPSTKLMAQIGVACLVVTFGGVLDWNGPAALDALATILWFVAITNAFNLLDNMDGVCAGVAAIAAFAYCFGDASTPPLVVYGAAIAGAAAGFLLYNFHPATIFLGDSGSLFLGSSFAVLTIAGDPPSRAGVISTLAVPALVLLLPIFDTLFVTVSRKLSARAASVGGRDHTSHRLVALGFTERQTALLLYALAAAGGGVALALRYSRLEGLALAALLLVAVTLLAVFLSGVSVYGGEDFRLLRGRRYTPLLVEFTYKRRIFEVLLDFVLIVVAYYSSFVIRFDRDFAANYPLFVQSLPIVIACQLFSFFVAGVYRGVWRYISVSDLTSYAKGIALGMLTSVVSLVVLFRFSGYSRGVFIIDAMLLGALLVGSRASFRLLGELASRYRPSQQRAMIYGAGDGGALLVRELRNNPRYQYRVVGFIDDDPAKKSKRIHGVEVLGGLERLHHALTERESDVLILSTAKLEEERVRSLRQLCYVTGVHLLQLRFELEEFPPLPITVEDGRY